MKTLLVKVSGESEEILNRLVNEGRFPTKQEAISAGILKLGKKYSIL